MLFIFLLHAFLTLGLTSEPVNSFINKHYDLSDGLSNNIIRAVEIDKDGIVWVGTNGGLDYFDGYRFNKVNTEGLIPDNNFIRSLCVDDNGCVWVGTASGLCRCSPHDMTLRRFCISSDENIDGMFILHIVKDADGILWMPAQNYGIIRLDPNSEEVSVLNKHQVKAITFDDKNNAFFVTCDGTLYKAGVDLKDPRPFFENISMEGIRGIHYAYGRLLLSFARYSAVVDLHTGEFISKNILPVTAVVPPSSGDLWLGTDNGVVIFDNNMVELPSVTESINRTLADTDPISVSLCKDGDGGVWRGTLSGLDHIMKNRSNLFQMESFTSDGKGKYICGIVADYDNTLWIETEDAGLMHYFPSENRVENLRIPGVGKSVNALCVDANYVWVGMYRQNSPLIRIDKKTGKIDSYFANLPNIIHLSSMKNGSVLISNSLGLFCFDGKECRKVKGFEKFAKAAIQDSRGDVWVATDFNGLWHCDDYFNDAKSECHWTCYNHDLSNPESIPSDKVMNVFEDSKSRIWILTELGGVALLDQTKSKFQSVEVGSKTAYSICEDSSGLLWITTSNGLVCLNPESFNFYKLSKCDGFLSDQYYYSSLAITQSGYLFASSRDGLVGLNPTALSGRSRNQKLALLELVPLKNGEELPSINIRKISNVRLPRSISSAKIRLALVSNNYPEIVKVAYKLDNSSIVTPVENGNLMLSGLSEGKHKIHIILENVVNKSEQEVKTIEVTVPKSWLGIFIPIWLTVFIALAAALFFVLRSLVRKRVRENTIQLTALLQLPENSVDESDDNFIKSVNSFLEENITNEDLRITDLAKHTCKSVSNLQRKMRLTFNLSAKEYIQQYRLKVALRLLCQDSIGVSEISEKVGFKTHSYFSNCFKKQFGVTPKEYKRRISSNLKNEK